MAIGEDLEDNNIDEPEGVESPREEPEEGTVPAQDDLGDTGEFDVIVDLRDETTAQVKAIPADVSAETEAEAEEPAPKKGHLKAILIIVILLLIIVGAVLGVFIWRNSLSPNVTPSDTEALTTGKAGTSNTSFEAIDAELIPDFENSYGLTVNQLKSRYGKRVVFEKKVVKSTDKTLKKMKYMLSGTVNTPAGEKLGSVSFGLNKDKKVLYVYSTTDLDAAGVATATFDELMLDPTVARSALVALGMNSAACKEAKLTVKDVPSAVTSNDPANKEMASFSGKTGLNRAFRSWKLTETYDHSVGKTVGDNSVIRTLTVEFS